MTYGPIVSVADVRRAGEDTLKLWLPSCLSEVARHEGLDPADASAVPRPRTWRRLPEFAALKDDQLPIISVTSPGLAGQPTRDGDGIYRATWRMVVAGVIRGDSFEDTAEKVSLYEAAIRLALVQHPSLGSFASSCSWTGSEYDALEAGAARTIGACFVDFQVAVDDVLDAFAGPLNPPADPLAPIAPDPTAETIKVLEQPMEE